jgi:hypothetical protein
MTAALPARDVGPIEASVSTLIEHLDRHDQVKSAPRRIAGQVHPL